MKRLLLIVLLLLTATTIFAQDVPDGFASFDNESYGTVGIVPTHWTSIGVGTYARQNSASDVVALLVQSAPLDRERWSQVWLPRLEQETLPESLGQIEGLLTWDDYEVSVAVQDMQISVSIALTEIDGATYFVLLQSLSEEHAELRETIYMPVVESIALRLDDTDNTDYISQDVTFTSGDLTLAGTLTVPNSDGQHPAVVLISGSGPSNRNESLAPLAEIEPFAILADHLTRNGIAVNKSLKS
ncbi:MAG: hypothetical protein Q9P44_08600 [Anaerolineae bacterium]|nr:hypothetical protein [Anaerolineae bacterium]